VILLKRDTYGEKSETVSCAFSLIDWLIVFLTWYLNFTADAVGQRSSNHLQHTLNEFPAKGKLLSVS